MSDSPAGLARILRVVAKHATACADELDPIEEEETPPSLEDIKAERAARHEKLGARQPGRS